MRDGRIEARAQETSDNKYTLGDRTSRRRKGGQL